MIEDVEVLYAEIQGETLGKTESAADRKIGLVNGKSAEMQATPFVQCRSRTSRMSSHPKALASIKASYLFTFFVFRASEYM